MTRPEQPSFDFEEPTQKPLSAPLERPKAIDVSKICLQCSSGDTDPDTAIIKGQGNCSSCLRIASTKRKT